MSVAQWTPETSLPAAMNAENATASTVVACLSEGLSDLLLTWNASVGITLRTSNVVEDG